MIPSSRQLMVAALLVAPAGAMAQNVKLHTIAGTWQEVDAGLGDSEFTSATTIPAGTQWTIWTVFEADTPVEGAQWSLHANGGLDNDKFQISDYAPGHLSDTFNLDLYDGLGSAFQVHSQSDPDPQGWPFDALVKSSRPRAFGQSDILFSLGVPTYLEPEYLNGKTVVGYVIENLAPIEPGDSYAISINGPIAGGTNAVWVASPFAADLFGDDFTISAIPEPASALLVLVGLPFLRRRRA